MSKILSVTEKILNNFPRPTIQDISGRPMQETIAAECLKLNTNASSACLKRVKWSLVLVHLTFEASVCLILVVKCLFFQTIQDITTTHSGATLLKINEILRAHKYGHEDFIKNASACMVLKSGLLRAVDESHIRRKGYVQAVYSNFNTCT